MQQLNRRATGDIGGRRREGTGVIYSITPRPSARCATSSALASESIKAAASQDPRQRSRLRSMKRVSVRRSAPRRCGPGCRGPRRLLVAGRVQHNYKPSQAAAEYLVRSAPPQARFYGIRGTPQAPAPLSRCIKWPALRAATLTRSIKNLQMQGFCFLLVRGRGSFGDRRGTRPPSPPCP